MDARQFLRGVDNPLEPYTLPHLGLNAGALLNRTAAQIIAGAQAQYADTMARAPFNISYTLQSLLQSFDDLNELSAALGVPVDVLAQQLASDPLEARQAYQAQIDAQQQAARMEAERVAYEQMLADIARQESEQRARQEAYIAQTQREVAAFEAQFQAMLAEQARLEAERLAAIEAERLAAERAQYEADNAQRIALEAELQRIAASGAVPVEDMIATGQFTQAQIDLASQVQSAQLLTQQEATRLELERQEAERAARVAVEVAQAQAEAAAAQAAEAERVRLYIEDQRAKAQADYEAQQAAAAQAAAPLDTEEAVMIDLEAAIAQGQADFNAAVRAIRSKIAEIAGARVYGVPYVLPVWSVEYPTIPADLVESLLAQFGLPSAAELEAELAASQAAAPVVDELPFVVVEESRQIVAPEVITAPAAPSDVIAPAVQQPVAPVVPTAPAAPAAGGGALLLALASAYFLGV